MNNANLQYYVTSSEPERIVELRNELAAAADPGVLLAAAYAGGQAWGADFWAATAIEYPCYYVWCHSRVPLAQEALAEQAADLNRQAGLARTTYVELPVVVFRPEVIVAVEQESAPPLVSGPAHHRDLHVWSAQMPVTLLRVGCSQPDTSLDWQALEPYVQLVGLHLSLILGRRDGMEAVEIMGNGENLDEETFFECVELSLADVHRRAGELSLLAMKITPEDKEVARDLAAEDWHRIWEQLRGELRRSDLVGQIGTGHYVVAMPLASTLSASAVADRIQQRVGQLANQGFPPMSLAMGISTWSAGRPGIGQLLWEARDALRLADESSSQAALVFGGEGYYYL